ncbi:MAG TPA: peptidylprolyl isomerase [Xanthobacteraceae bacterium]|nr:peptidylprolyl isomerase [Xanthobacteraceae bacterium]
MRIFQLIALLCALAFPLSANAQQNFDPWRGTSPEAKAKEKPDAKAERKTAQVKAKNKTGGADTLTLETTKGKIVIRLRTDLAPNHAKRLQQLASEGFYNNVPFHRVIDGFMAQTGDGQHGNGTGGSTHPDLRAEFSSVPFRRGIVGMARKGGNNNSANSQFFIMFAEQSSLNGQYTVIGEVVSGMDVVDKINKGEPPRNPDRILRAIAGQ